MRWEKAQQIALMGDIYRQARKVRLWLGDADEEAPRVLAFLRVIASIAEDAHGHLERVHDLARNMFNLESLAPVERFSAGLGSGGDGYSKKLSWHGRLSLIAETTASHCQTL
jgi:hypothetical protein